ncbi:hypothetical protein IM816_00720 [Luteibacter flocculans]|uniref:Uncharacterized protein n=1 Tax=Luteibacter flocculans TaxID=2780091 RepID=A0ABY4T158_9GAMM|nr:hypothetical protein [Luteibacter flocculans]URL58697.1 hypothetical protein IM816_00720 [Luteibacter flocculans]
MNTLPHARRFRVPCTDRTGLALIAEVTATREHTSWFWHAVFPGTGVPPAEILGASRSFDEIATDICKRVSTLQAVGAVIEESGEADLDGLSANG